MQDFRNSRRLAVAVLALVVTACATSSNPATPAWNRYVEFDRALTYNSSADLEPFLSAQMLHLVETVPSGEDERKQYREEASYPLWLDSETEHHEKKTADGGACLTVNGLSRDGGPASLTVRFVEEDQLLRADEIIYGLVESADQLPTTAQCPSEFMASETDV